jgi:hypothetical protein
MVGGQVRAGRVPLEEVVLLRRRRGQQLEYRNGNSVVSHFVSTVEKLEGNPPRNGTEKLFRNREEA